MLVNGLDVALSCYLDLGNLTHSLSRSLFAEKNQPGFRETLYFISKALCDANVPSPCYAMLEPPDARTPLKAQKGRLTPKPRASVSM